MSAVKERRGTAAIDGDAAGVKVRCLHGEDVEYLGSILGTLL